MVDFLNPYLPIDKTDLTPPTLRAQSPTLQFLVHQAGTEAVQCLESLTEVHHNVHIGSDSGLEVAR